MTKEKSFFVVIANGLLNNSMYLNPKFLFSYNKPPYIYCERESKELLSLCLKRIKELNHFKLNDATFIWTEPHSRRIRLRLTLQQEVRNKINQYFFKKIKRLNQTLLFKSQYK